MCREENGAAKMATNMQLIGAKQEELQKAVAAAVANAEQHAAVLGWHM